MTTTWRHRAAVVLPYVGFFLLLLWMTLPSGATSVIGGNHLNLFDDSARLRAILGGSDAGSLLTAAENFKANGRITPEFRWVFDYWPPGMVMVDRVLLQLEKWTGIPITPMMIVLNCGLWALLLGAWFNLIRAVSSLWPALLFGAGVLVYSGISNWGVGNGMFYSDSFGVIGFCFALFCLLQRERTSTTRSRRTWLILSGVSLALGAYFRASFELVADATLALAVLVIVVALVARWRGGWGRYTAWSFATVLPIAIVAGIAQLIMLPWRIYLGLVNHPGDFRWSAVSDLASVARWLPESVLREDNNLFGLAGHSNWACLSDPEQCSTIFRLELKAENPYGGSNGGYFTGSQFDQMTLHSFFTHPFAFITERLDALSLGFAANTGSGVSNVALPESLAIVALFVTVVVVFIRTKAFSNLAYLFLFVATAAQLATLALLHMESRYFLGIELSIILVGAFTVASVYGRRGARAAASVEDSA